MMMLIIIVKVLYFTLYLIYHLFVLGFFLFLGFFSVMTYVIHIFGCFNGGVRGLGRIGGMGDLGLL